MSRRQLIFLYLFILFTDVFAQKFHPKLENNDREQPQSTDRIQPSIYSERKLPANNRGNNDNQQQSVVDQSRPRSSIESYRRSSSSSTALASSNECKFDMQKYCNKGSQQLLSNLKVLQCVDDLDHAVNLISKECQHLIYKFKYNMTLDPHFDDTAERQCSKDLKVFDECKEYIGKRGSGRLVTCLYDLLPNITESSCRYFIKQMQAVVFNDWRLMEYFAYACMNDMKNLECGRLDDENEAIPHKPGAVVSCLSQKYTKLSSQCRREIFRLAEMQSDDYHLDRALYYACRDDRERLCEQVSSGNGRIYRCLYDQKFNSMMSPACRKEVHRRQSLVVADVKLDVPLTREHGWVECL
ncbi:unnamed protein product [Rotaria sordida]|uniref:Golgi apparatus protein 1 n=1 Tax=Rotaria sordida TaxID=392033 RepID=A0A815MTQ9_9BILA|nr:unnamed protein product [Rotaria sordida]